MIMEFLFIILVFLCVLDSTWFTIVPLFALCLNSFFLNTTFHLLIDFKKNNHNNFNKKHNQIITSFQRQGGH